MIPPPGPILPDSGEGRVAGWRLPGARVGRWIRDATIPDMLVAVCVDLMDTVLRDPYHEALAAATGLDLEAIQQLRDPDAWPAFETAKIDEAAFVRRFFRDDGRDFDIEAFHQARRAGYRMIAGMAELLTELDGRLQRYVASNYPVWIDELRTDFGLDELFEGVWSSHHLGVRKPDPAFYGRLLDRIGHDAEECLFVDDRRHNCEAAAAAGFRTHLFTGAAGFRLRLRAEGVAV